MKVLYLCTGNSCRSQMCEGFTRALARGGLEVRSAGIEAHGKNSRAIAVMAEAGYDIFGQESTSLTEEMLEWADLVVTVCGHADEHCPVLPRAPARSTGPWKTRRRPKARKKRS